MKLSTAVIVVALAVPSVARAQDASVDAAPDANVCPRVDDEVGPCRERSIGDPCTLSTGKDGACIQSECLTQSVCRANVEPTSGCCDGGGGGGGGATPAIFVLGFAVWKRRRFAVTARRSRS